MKWTSDKIELLKVYLNQGLHIPEIAASMSLSYDQIKHAIQRYSLRGNVSSDAVFHKEKNKLTGVDISKLARLIGEKLYDEYSTVDIKEPPVSKSTKKREEISILDISDVHLGTINEVFDDSKGGKVVTYNMDIFKKELGILQQSVKNIHKILSTSYNLKKLVIFVLGDIITNDRIFPEQTMEIEKVVGLQIWDGVNYFNQFFANLLQIYQEIEVVAVCGNHGRSNPHHYNEPVENNFEYFMYKSWQKQWESSKRVNIIVPETRRYIHEIYGWKHLIEHGDSLRGSSDVYIEKQIKELSLNLDGFDMFHFGHFHKLKEREIADKVVVKQNGCWVPKDSYGFAKFNQYSVPKQFFFGCSPKRVETWNYKIDLRS